MPSHTLGIPIWRLVYEQANFYSRLSLVLTIGLLVLFFLTPLAILSWGRTTYSWVFARVLSYAGLVVLGIRVRVEGRENLPHEPAIYMANHQSNFDILTMGRVFPRGTVVIGKKELARVPLFGTFFAATGNVLIDRSDRTKAIGGLDGAVDALRNRRKNIWIFPEGTRSAGRGLGRFKKGGFHMAAAADVPVVPIVSSPMDEVLDGSRRTLKGGTITIRILPPIVPTETETADAEKLRDRTEAIFRKEWAQRSVR